MTDGHFRIEWAVGYGAPEVKVCFPPAVDATLVQILSQKVNLGTKVPLPSQGEANTYKGILKWTQRNPPTVAKQFWGR